MFWGSEAPKRGLNLPAEYTSHVYGLTCATLANNYFWKWFWGVFSAQGCKGTLPARLSRSPYRSHNILNQEAWKLAWKMLRKYDAAA